MNNLAIYLGNGDEYFETKKIYETSNIYNGMIDIYNEKSKGFITCDIENKDFIFILNPTKDILDILQLNT